MSIHQETLRPYRPPLAEASYAFLLVLPVIASVLALWLPAFIAIPLFGVSLAAPVSFQLFLHRPDWVVGLGQDGLSVLHDGREQFVPWNQFVGFVRNHRGIVAKTREGDVPLGCGTSVMARLKTMTARLRSEREGPNVMSLLVDQDEEHWPLIIERAAQGDFRSHGITQAQLIEDLLNPATPPAMREALASGLRVRVPEADVQDTIKVLASERSRKTLHCLLETSCDSEAA